VLIGQNLNQDNISDELRTCLCNEQEISYYLSGGKFSDLWPL
jgi:hypothetical protein